ncbi:hypothetical protein [Nitrosomonas sp.]|uniref:hypothetical protein n=1 Tax=Nitrosomonas sp. TaxID=42353 RepID=UPI0027303356|nr:hypothetical protein [Nitrosomonas sp.]MDP2222797.1 hypothetical protein [Nitrosomonas sp.]
MSKHYCEQAPLFVAMTRRSTYKIQNGRIHYSQREFRECYQLHPKPAGIIQCTNESFNVKETTKQAQVILAS